MPSAGAGLNLGLAQAKTELVVFVHQDVYLPRGWCKRFAFQWQNARVHFGSMGVAGIYGVAGRCADARRAGHVVDRVRLLREPVPLPAVVDSLDELLLALPRDTRIRFDPALGFHMYATDACLAARRLGLVNVVLDAPCLHNSASEVLPPEFAASVSTLVKKWPSELPVATPCVKIRPDGRFDEWRSPVIVDPPPIDTLRS